MLFLHVPSTLTAANHTMNFITNIAHEFLQQSKTAIFEYYFTILMNTTLALPIDYHHPCFLHFSPIIVDLVFSSLVTGMVFFFRLHGHQLVSIHSSKMRSNKTSCFTIGQLMTSQNLCSQNKLKSSLDHCLTYHLWYS